MNKILKVGIESLVVGIMTVLVGSLVGFLVGMVMKTELPPVCKDWNKNFVMEISLFLTGVFIHLFCEFTGVNAWYCVNGAACN